jgi:hypothetical protein
MITAAFAIIAIAATTQAGAQYGAYAEPYYNGYYAGGNNQNYYNSYNADHAYGYRTFANRPSDNASQNKRHLEGWES